MEKDFITAFTNGQTPNNTERKLLSLHCKLGGTGIVIFADIARREYQNLRNNTESLTKLHSEQCTENNINREKIAKFKNDIKKEKFQSNTERFQSFLIGLPSNKIHSNEINQENGASTLL